MLRRVLVGLLLGVAAAALSIALGNLELVAEFENKTYDRLVRATATPLRADSPIVIVEINESTIRALEPMVGRWPWPRVVHAGAVDYLARTGAKVIAYDVLFGDREGRSEFVLNNRTILASDSDSAFVEAVRNAGNVVLLADAVFEGQAGAAQDSPAPVKPPGVTYTPGDGFQRRPNLRLPFESLASAAAGVGHNVLVRDPRSDAARRMLPFIESHGTFVPSLGLAAALRFLGAEPTDVRLEGDTLRIKDARMPLLAEPVPGAAPDAGSSRQVLLRFPRPLEGQDGVRSMFPSYSFFDVLLSQERLASGQEPALPVSAFAGKLVIVGATASGTYDRFATPFDGGAAGAEIHATVAENVLAQSFMRRAPARFDRGLTVAAGVGAAAAATLLPVAAAVAVVLTSLAALVWWALVQVRHGEWIALVMPVSAAAIALFSGIAWEYFVEGREKRRVRKLFARYVSKDVIEQLMADPGLARLGGQRREMTVLFSDIRGFTSATERGQPEAVVAQLNEYFGAMVDVLFRHHGTLDKFVGDMVMGLFGAPLADPRHADHAVAAAVEMRRSLATLNEKWRGEGRPAVDIGIGINTGEMIAGNIGSEAIMSYTVIGDAVNLGARLESLNKEYGTHILISEATRAQLTLPIETRLIGEVVVKGRTQAVKVYEVP